MTRAALLFVALTACTGAKLSAVRTTVSQQTGCPEPKLNVVEQRNGWFATGCDTRYFCQATSGPCAEDPTDPQRLARARAAFSKEGGCPLMDITVTYEPRGFGAQGCGRYAVCAGYDGPCMPATPPTCQDLAKWRFDVCSSEAHREGSSGRNNQNYYRRSRSGIASAIAGNITATVRENDAVDQCRAQFDAESRSCK